MVHTNKKSLYALFFIILLFFSGTWQAAVAKSIAKKDQTTRTLVHLLDYIASDYAQAIEAGKVINKFEYKEMIEFADRVEKLYRNTRSEFTSHDTTVLIGKFQQLKVLINEKAPIQKVVRQARSINQQIRTLSDIKLTPQQWPDLSKGKRIYKEKCTRCHGASGKGEGTIASTLDPPPTNFVEDSRVANISPFQAYNTTRLGIEGTSMTPFKELTNEEVWQVAFYVLSLRHHTPSTPPKGRLQQLYQKVKSKITLKQVALSSDHALMDTLTGSKQVKKDKVSAIRLHQTSQKTVAKDSGATTLSTAHQLLDSAATYYRQKQYKKATSAALWAYLDGIEPMEPRLRIKSQKLVNRLEADMAAVRNTIKQRKKHEQVEAAVAKAHQTIDEAAETLADGPQSFWLTFTLTIGILLREGLEACLIIIVILGIIRAAKAPKAAKWVHGGWMGAVVVGLLGWFFTDWIISIGVKNRELAEAVASLVAVGVLLYVGYWLHNKTKASQWKAFVEGKLKTLLRERNMLGLSLLSFIVVFREAFETVLFLSALQLEAGKAGSSAIGLGTITSLVGIFIMGWAMLKYSLKLPIRQLFTVSSLVVGVLAVILVGKGVHALQEVNIISATFIDSLPQSHLLGIYPTWETVAAQLVVFVSAFLPWTGWMNKIKNRSRDKED